MSIYDLPKFNFNQKKDAVVKKVDSLFRESPSRVLATVLLVAIMLGFGAGVLGGYSSYKVSSLSLAQTSSTTTPQNLYTPQDNQEGVVIQTVKNVSPAVVSIIITKDVPIVQQMFGNPFEDLFGQNFFNLQFPQSNQKTQKQEVGGGSGFLASQDGLVVTNKHVVMDESAEYTVYTNDGKSYPAKVLAKDPVQDLAVLKIEGSNFPYLPLGNSDGVQIGQTVIAIGNALGEFRNTVSVGVISGLGRSITASDGQNFVETLDNVIQTDAAINRGNSGGPLLNLAGEVVGINTATVSGAQSIGFAIPINAAKRDVEQVKSAGKITYPFLGIRYTMLNAQIAQENNLSQSQGAWVKKGSGGEAAVVSGSAAAKAGIQEGDIIIELNGEKITTDNPLQKIIRKYSPGDTVSIKLIRNGSEETLSATLGEVNS